MLEHEKMVDLDKLLLIRKFLKSEGKSVVFTNGCYDIVHPGHVDLLARAKASGDVLVLALNTDASVRRQNKGIDRPINSFEERAFLLAHMAAVDYIVAFDEDTPYTLIGKLLPDVLIKGGDWPVEKIVGHEIVEKNGGKVLSLPLISGYSSTKIIEKIRSFCP